MVIVMKEQNIRLPGIDNTNINDIILIDTGVLYPFTAEPYHEEERGSLLWT